MLVKEPCSGAFFHYCLTNIRCFILIFPNLMGETYVINCLVCLLVTLRK